MRCWLFVLFVVYAHTRSYGKLSASDGRCQKWSCMNEKLNLTDSPTKEQYGVFLRSSLPEDWRVSVDAVLDACYEKTLKYRDSCPGQELMHCIVEQLNKNCPAGSWRKEDACAAIWSTVSDADYLFSQGRYSDIEKNWPNESVPEELLRRFFSEKCCDLPTLYNNALLECGFKELLHYNVMFIQKEDNMFYTTPKVSSPNPQEHSKRNVYDIIMTTPKATTSGENRPTTTDNIIFNEYEEPLDPLDCCDMENFIQKQWRSDCNFKLEWDDDKRLTVVNTSDFMSTPTTERSLKNDDIKIVPISCEKETCVFSKLNIISNGVVDKDAFLRLLDNMTDKHPEWSKAKARVVTQCLNKPIIDYDTDCEINKILGCTFDILSENCPYPYENKNDSCKHSTSVEEGIVCQISASKFRPKHRRQFCNLPDFSTSGVHSECGVHLIYKPEYVPRPAVKTNSWVIFDDCKDLTESSTCLLKKMDVLNSYGFIDRFKMRRSISLYSTDFPPMFEDMYKNHFENGQFYKNQCSTSRKLLNVIDSMFMTCPYLKFKRDEKCINLIKKIRRVSDFHTFKQVPNSEAIPKKVRRTVSNKSSYKNNPIYNFGILGAGNIPPVHIIDVKPTEKTLVLLPVYSRMPKDPLSINSLHNDGIFRS